MWMRIRSGLPLLLAFALLPLCDNAMAQEIATSFSELRPRVQPGEQLDVTDARGRTLKGTLAALTDSSLALQLGDNRSAPPLELSEADVNNIAVKRSDPVWNGPLIGLAIGVGAGTLIELGGKTEYQKFSGSGAISMGVLMLATGFVIDLLNKEKTTLYVNATPAIASHLTYSFRFAMRPGSSGVLKQ